MAKMTQIEYLAKKEEDRIKQASLPKEKFYYDVKIETMLPATITFRVLAETPEQALLLSKNMSPIGVQHRLAGRKDKKATVYAAGSNLIKFIRNLI